MHCFRFLFWLKFCSVLESFSFGVQKKWSLVTLDRWLSYVVMIVWEVAWVDSALVGLDIWLSFKGGHLSRFDCISLVKLFI